MRSMTGYGRVEGELSQGTLTVEIRTVNHRFLDIALRMPRIYFSLEDKVQRLVKKRIGRGRVDLAVQRTVSIQRPVELALNLPLARGYLEVMRRMKAELGVSGEIDVSTLLGQSDIVVFEEEKPDLAGEAAVLFEVCGEALQALRSVREREGEMIRGEITSRVEAIKGAIDEVASLVDRSPSYYREKIARRIESLALDPAPDEQRIMQEVAFLIDKGDVTEEITRAKTHLERMLEFVDAEEPIGRKLDFLVQELLRETNTIASKTDDTRVSHLVVEAKAEIEKIREQVQNVE